MKSSLAPLAALALFALAIVLTGCGPTAEEQAGADRMQKGMESSRNAMNSPRGGAPGPASR